MRRALDQLFKNAVNRMPKRLSFDTTYSHGNIYDWLKTILTDWTIIIPGSRRRKLQIDRCIQHRTIDRERLLDREEEKVATDR
jgi:hypothetical protein